MTTARDMIQDAFEGIQVYAPGETATNADVARALSALNQMVDSWSNESLTCYAILEQSGLLVPGQYQYTIGPGGNYNVTRPIRLIKTPGAVYIVDNNGNRYNLEVVERDQWNLIGNIVNVTSNFPNVIFYDPQYPLGIINIFPVPDIGWTMYWDSYLQITEFPSLTTQLNLPPGYQKAIVSNLSIELSAYYPTAKVTPALIRAASQSKGNVKRSNYRLNIALFDSEIIRTGQSQYNIYSDSPRGAM